MCRSRAPGASWAAASCASQCRAVCGPCPFHTRVTSHRPPAHPARRVPARRRVVFGGTRSRPVVHRLALFSPGGHLSHVISQSDVIK
jgi:hypothetical protein